MGFLERRGAAGTRHGDFVPEPRRARHLLEGVSTGINALASLAMFLSFAARSLVFLPKDAPGDQGVE